MFEILSVERRDAETVHVRVRIPVKAWNKARRDGLGSLYGVDISNAVHRAYGVKAYNPSVADRQRAMAGFKFISLYYQDATWTSNVIRVDFRARRRVA